MLEKFGGAAIVLGTVLTAVGGFWFLWRLLRAMFGKSPWSKLLQPLGLLLMATLLIAVPIAVNALRPLDLGPHEQIVDGEIHLTLTGWGSQDDHHARVFEAQSGQDLLKRLADEQRYDYARVLSERSQATVLQMANSDVTDDTLKLLIAMPNLRELDVNDSQITDAGLATLAALPQLESLRLARTAITDDGFREYLLEKESLLQLDLTGTSVASKTVRQWKAAHEGRQALK